MLSSVCLFLQQRGFIEERTNRLSDWGEILKSALLSLRGRKDLEEAVYLGIELLKCGLLNADVMVSDNFVESKQITGLNSLLNLNNNTNDSQTRIRVHACL